MKARKKPKLPRWTVDKLKENTYYLASFWTDTIQVCLIRSIESTGVLGTDWNSHGMHDNDWNISVLSLNVWLRNQPETVCEITEDQAKCLISMWTSK